MSSLSPNLRGIICMILAGLAFVVNDVCLKMLLADHPPFQSLALRGSFAIIACLILVISLGYARQLRSALGIWPMARALCEWGAVAGYAIALAVVPLGSITAIYQTAPLIVLAGASVIWHEKVGGWRWALIALGLAGALLVAQPGSEGASPYALLGFITAIMSAARDLLSRKVPDTLPGPIAALSVVTVVTTCAFIAHTFLEDWAPVVPSHVALAVGSGVFVMFAHLFIFLAFRLATARAVAPFYYSLTVFAVILGALFFDEIPNMLGMLGMGLILSCGIGVLLLEKRNEQA